MTKQTTFIIKIMADEWKTEGSPEIWEALQLLRNHADVEITNTIHGSLPDNISIHSKSGTHQYRNLGHPDKTKADAAIEEAVESALKTVGLDVIKSKPFFGMNSETTKTLTDNSMEDTLLHPCQEFLYNQQETGKELKAVAWEASNDATWAALHDETDDARYYVALDAARDDSRNAYEAELKKQETKDD